MENEELIQKIDNLTDQFTERMKSAATKEEVERIKEAAKAETKELIESVKAAITTDIQTKLDEQREILKSQGEALDVLKQAAVQVKAEPMTLRESLKQAIIESGFVEKYSHEELGERYRIKGANMKNFGVEVEFRQKAAVDMNTANAVRPGSSPGVNIGFLTNYGMQPIELATSMNQHFVGAGFPVEPIAEKYYGVLVEGTETDGAAVKTETGAAGDSSYLWKTIEYKVFDFSCKFRVHQNTLDDIDRVVNRITTIGVDRLLSVIDSSALGAAGDNSATPLGIKTSGYFTAYDTTLRANLVTAPTIVDVIKNMVLQANNADMDVDALIINRSDVAEIESLKDENANTVNLAGIKLDEKGKLAYIYGMKVIINNKQTARTLHVLKLSESLQFGDRQMTKLRMGYDQTTDFTKNIVTLQLDARAAIGIGNPLSIIYCSDVDAAITALTVV